MESLQFGLVVGDVVSGVGFRPFWLRLPVCGHQAHDGIFDSRFLVETRL